MPDRLTILGPLHHHYSVSKVDRELLLALHREGYPVCGVDTLNTPTDRRYQALTRHLIREQPEGLIFTFGEHGLPQPLKGPQIRMEVADDWLARPEKVKAWNDQQQFLLAPSRHSQEWLQRQGCRDVRLCPLGVNPRDYYPARRPAELLKRFEWVVPGALDDQTFVLVHYGCLQERKGTKELLAAYREAFRPRDNVCLILHNGKAGWSEDLKPLLRDLTGCAPILKSTGDLLLPEVRGLLSFADLGVFPNYIEGYGLCGLETLACGTPVILPAHTGNLEYADDSACWLLRDFTPERVHHAAVDDRMPIEWYRPSVAELGDLLWELYSNRDLLRAKAEQARPVALRHTWEVAAHTLAGHVGLKAAEPSTDGRTTVVTLARNNAPMTATTVESVSRTRSASFDHVVVDNGSKEAEAFAEIGRRFGVRILRVENPDEYGVLARNLVWQPAATEFVAGVDNDVTVQPDWLAKGTAYLRAHREVGLVGIKTFRPNGKLWHCGADPDAAGNTNRHRADGEPDGPAWQLSGPVPVVPFACIVARREALRQAGWQWWEYKPCWWEDVDLCAALWAMGWEIHVLASTSCVNQDSATIKTMGGLDGLGKVFWGWWRWLYGPDEPWALRVAGGR